MATDAQVNLYKRSFRLLDEGTGRVTTANFKLLVRGFGQNPTDAQFDTYIQEIDSKQQGVDFPGFLTVMERIQNNKENSAELEESFKVFDKDGNAKISSAELQSVLTELGEKLSPAEIESLLQLSKVTAEGQIDYPNLINELNWGLSNLP